MIARLACALFFLCFASAEAKAWIVEADSRVDSQSSRVGIISFDLPEGRSTGTAFLVSRCEIMTNFHVAFGPWYVTALKPPSREQRGVFTLTGVTLADGSHPQAEAFPVAWGDYRGPDRQFRSPGEDWTLLTLGRCLGEAYGYFIPSDPAFTDGVAEAQGLSAIGYSSGRQMIDSGCSLLSGGNGVLLHDCAALAGDSGGPVFSRIGNKVVAITSGTRSAAAGGTCAGAARGCANTAVPLSLAVIRHLEAAIAAVDTQRELLRLGYGAGQLGDTGHPAFTAAVADAQSHLGFAVTGEPSCSLTLVLKMVAAAPQ